MNNESNAQPNAGTRVNSPPALPRRDGQPPVVVLADDHAATRRSLAEFLRHHHFVVHEAATGIELFDATQATWPDVILLDTRMPDTDGVEAIGDLKADPLTAAVPIIALSPVGLRNEREKCLAAGALRFITLPVDPDQLRRIILSLLTSPPNVTAEDAVGF